MSDIESKSHLELAEATLQQLKNFRVYPTIIHDKFVNSLRELAKKNDSDSARILEIVQELIAMKDAYIMNRDEILQQINHQRARESR